MSTAPSSTAGSGTQGAVRLTGVSKRFGEVTAVDSLDLAVQPGEFLSLLGPSGCGKTTTLRLLAGFEQPDSGHITISGRAVEGVPPHKRDVNTVFQAYALFPHMSVAENVAYGLRQKRVGKPEIRERVSEALDMVKMTAMAGRRPRQLSGGQQQRVAVARALVNRPSVLLLDEPLGALDRKLREDMQIELKLLQSKLGITFVFVTHDQSEALSMSDRIAVMLDGRIEQLGEPDEIYDRPASAFVAGFIGQQNFFRGTAFESGAVVRGEPSGEASWVMRSSRDRSRGIADGPALAAVRPECVELSDVAPAASENVVRGELAGVSHLGDVIQYVVVATAGEEILARRPRSTAPRLEVGSPVWCSWNADDVRVFGSEQADVVLAAAAEAAE